MFNLQYNLFCTFVYFSIVQSVKLLHWCGVLSSSFRKSMHVTIAAPGCSSVFNAGPDASRLKSVLFPASSFNGIRDTSGSFQAVECSARSHPIKPFT
jgi:hypothetical protein